MFLQKVYHQWKTLFWVIILFTGAQFFFMFKGIQTIPFFIYHMYSVPHTHHDSIAVVLIKTNEGYFSPFTISNREAELLTNNIAYYIALKNNHYKDPVNVAVQSRFKNRFSPNNFQYLQQSICNDSIAIDQYPLWWKSYFESVNMDSFDSVSVVLSHVSYQPFFSKSPVDSIIFTLHKTP